MGRTNDAARCFNSALTNRVNQADDLAELARFCASRRWFELAVTNFAAAIELCPADPGLRLEAGRALTAIGRHDEAARQYQAAVEMEPEQAQPHMQLGVALGRLESRLWPSRNFGKSCGLDPNSIAGACGPGGRLVQTGKA